MSRTTQRDAFWTRIYEHATTNRDIIVVSADMGAPALDQFRENLGDQFVNAGIAEQNAIVVGSGLAREGKTVLVYAIASFITLRCLEQIRVENAMMKIPLTIVGVGAGFGYFDSGPTHHMLEDLSVLRSFPTIRIDSVTDNVMAAAIADLSVSKPAVNYVRLDREPLPDLYGAATDFSDGVASLRDGGPTLLVSTGAMTHAAMELSAELEAAGHRVGVIDLYRLPINTDRFLDLVRGADRLITLEEHFLPGGLGSAVCEILQDNGVQLPVSRFGLPIEQGYCYEYGSREAIRQRYGLSRAVLRERILDLLSTSTAAG